MSPTKQAVSGCSSFASGTLGKHGLLRLEMGQSVPQSSSEADPLSRMKGLRLAGGIQQSGIIVLAKPLHIKRIASSRAGWLTEAGRVDGSPSRLRHCDSARLVRREGCPD